MLVLWLIVMFRVVLILWFSVLFGVVYSVCRCVDLWVMVFCLVWNVV